MNDAIDLTFWHQATAWIAKENAPYLPQLGELLSVSELPLAKILTGRLTEKSSTAEQAIKLDELMLAALANGTEVKTVIAWLRILYVAIKSLNGQGYQLKSTRLALYIQSAPNPFAPERVALIAKAEIWKRALYKGIQTQNNSQPIDEHIALIALSSVMIGCLLDSTKLKVLMESLQQPIQVAGNLAFIEFHLPFLANPDAQMQRWFLDPITELLLAKLSESDYPLQIDGKALLRHIRHTMVKYGCDKKSRPKSIAELIDVATIDWESRTAHIDIQFMQRRYMSHSLKSATWLRINGCAMASTQRDFLRADRAKKSTIDDQDAVETKEMVKDSVSGVAWFQAISTAIEKRTLHEIRPVLTGLLVDFPDNTSTAGTYLNWLDELLTKRASAGSKLALSTASNLFLAVTRTMLAIIGEDNPSEYQEEDLKAVFKMLLTNIPEGQQKTLLAKGLRELVGFLGKKSGKFTCKDTREVLGDEAVLSPVEANIITFDDFEATKHEISQRALMIDPNRVDAALLAFILVFRLGLRRMEAFGLLLVDFHMEGKEVVLIRPHEERRLKTDNAIRSLPLRAFLSREELARLRTCLAKRLAEEKTKPFSPFLFANPAKGFKIISAETTTDLIHESMRKVTGDGELHLHHLRHSFGTWTYLKLRAWDHPTLRKQFEHLPHTYWYLSQGKRLRILLTGHSHGSGRSHAFVVARLLGHSGPNISMVHYIHSSDLIVWAESMREVEQLPQSVLAAASSLPQSVAYVHLEKGWQQLLAAVRKKACNRYVVHQPPPPPVPVVAKATVLKNQVKTQWIGLHKRWQVLHLVDAGRTDIDAISQDIGLDKQIILHVLTQAEKWQAKICVKFRAEAKIGRPDWPHIAIEKDFITDMETRLKKLAATDPALFEAGIGIYLDHYNRQKRDVVFKDKKDEHLLAKQYVKFLHKLGYPDEQMRMVVRTAGTEPNNLAKWQKKLALQQAKVDFVAAPVAGNPAYAKWIGLQMLDEKGKGHHSAMAVGIYLAALGLDIQNT